MVFHVHHIDALVPDAAVGGQFRQFAIGQVAVALVGETRSERVAEDDCTDLPVADIDHAVTIQVAVVGVHAVAVVVPADRVVVADNGLSVVDIGFEVGHDPHTGVWGTFRNLAQHLLVAVGHVGGVEVGQSAMFVAAEVVVEPVFQGQQALFRVGGDGEELHDTVLHRLVVEVVAGSPARRTACTVPAAPVGHVGGSRRANHFPGV